MGLEDRSGQSAPKEEKLLEASKANKKAEAVEGLQIEAMAILHETPGFDRAATEAILAGERVVRVDLSDGKILEAWGNRTTSKSHYSEYNDPDDPHMVTESGDTNSSRVNIHIQLRHATGSHLVESGLHLQTEQWVYSGNPARDVTRGEFSTEGAIGNSGPDYDRRMTEVQALAAASGFLQQLRLYSIAPRPG